MKMLRNVSLAFLVGLGAIACAPPSNPKMAAAIVGTGVFVSDTGQTIRADYRANDTVTLTLANGDTKVLDQAIAGSGIRYVAGSHQWWEHQGEAIYSIDDNPVFVGKRKQ